MLSVVYEDVCLSYQMIIISQAQVMLRYVMIVLTY